MNIGQLVMTCCKNDLEFRIVPGKENVYLSIRKGRTGEGNTMILTPEARDHLDPTILEMQIGSFIDKFIKP